VTASTVDAAATRFDGRPVFVFSTPPTPNGDLHLGHLSGPYLGADVFVRFQRMNGATAWHLTGSDDFQSYVVGRARAEGRDPAATAAHYSAEIAATLRLMDIEPDQYTVTSVDPAYRSGLRAFFARLVGSGSVALREDPGLVDAVTGAYLYEVDVSGGCPHCGEPTGGNICEECGEPNACADLLAPRSARSDAPPRRDSVTRYSLPLHEFRAHIAAHHRTARTPARLKELAERLFARDRVDVAVTHPSSWGVPPPEPGADGQVIWVWPEMAYGFLHGIESLGTRIGRDWRADAPQADWKIVHFFGFDNSFYHAILYPVLYRLAHPDWTPDIDYHVNEFYLLDGEKFSTSRRHAIWGKDVLGPHSVDAVRFFLSRTRSEGRRTNFETAAYEAVLRGRLVGAWQRWLNDLGARIDELYSGAAPEPATWTPEHTAFLGRLGTRLSALTECLSPDGFSLNQAAETLDGIVEDAIRFSRSESPVARIGRWRDEARTATALELAAARLLAYTAAPVMPRFAAGLAAALGVAVPANWPRAVTLVEPGTRIDLAHRTFFGGQPGDRQPGDRQPGDGQPPVRAGLPPASLLPWLRGLVRSTLQLPQDEPVDDRALADLGMESLHAVALQYQILEEIAVDIPVEDLFGAPDVDALARLLDERTAEDAARPVTQGVPG